MKERYLIIDGYNMIGQSSALSAIAKESLEEAREQLLAPLARTKHLSTLNDVPTFENKHHQ